MTRKNWSRIQPSSLRNALELCKDHAREKKRLSVEGIAELLGMTDHWTVYKWLQNGRIPASMIRPYEEVCGINYVTRWLAASSGCLMIKMPTGRTVDATEIQALQTTLHDAVGALMAFYGGGRSADETLSALRAGMEGLAWHHGNVERHTQPELELHL